MHAHLHTDMHTLHVWFCVHPGEKREGEGSSEGEGKGEAEAVGGEGGGGADFMFYARPPNQTGTSS